MNVLDLGTGTGFIATCLAHLVGPLGRVISLDKNKDNIEFACQVISTNYPELKPRIEFYEGEAQEGYLEASPYNTIHVGSAVHAIPNKWIQQLEIGGQMIVPLVVETLKGGNLLGDDEYGERLQKLYHLVKTGNSTYRMVEIMEVSYEEME
eukprot:TRINITY_DN4978_c0_g1_i3.p2 TRINITY_DN4978_c0_g1~~TRINITY_DN4978_c0_g1_i3.p2  ORF type:complete len:151 (-),score=31.46 TRINITY_DN4978_c0_g1_i3:295-747(-)